MNFFCNNKKYPVDISIFSQHSAYFSKGDKNIWPQQEQSFRDINLLSDFDSISDISDESINTFLDYCQNKPIKLKPSNVIQVQYLSNKYEVSQLKEHTEKFISSNFKSVIDTIFSNKNIDYQTENIIQKNLFKILNDDRLFSIPVPSMHRIISAYSKNKEKDLIEFIFKYIDHQGESSLILLTEIEIDEKNQEFIDEKLNEYKKYINNPAIQMKIIENMHYMNHRNKERENNIEQMRTEFNYQIDNLTNQISQLKDTLSEVTDFKHSDKNNFESFNKFKGETQAFIMTYFGSIYDNIQDIADFFSYLSREQIKAKYKFSKMSYVYIEARDMNEKLNNLNFKDMIEKFILKSNTVEMLYENRSLESTELLNNLNNIDKLYFEINYPSSKYQQIYDKITKLKELIKDKNKIKIKVIISKITDKDKHFRNNKNINSFQINAPLPISLHQLFESMASLEEIIVSPSVPLIESKCFSNCSQVNKININPCFTRIEKNAFNNCDMPKKLIFSSNSSISNIKNAETNISNIPNIIKITISSSVKSIGPNFFNGCPNMSEIMIDPYLTQINSSAFSNCSKSKHLIISTKHSSIDENIISTLFKSIQNITQITILNGITSIGERSFHNSNKLTRITILSSLISIGSSAFSYCSSLTQITLPQSVTSIGNIAFSNCSSLTQIGTE